MLSPNGTQAILFDLDGTLRHSQPEGSDVFIAYARSLGLRISEDDRLRALRWEHYYWANSFELQGDMAKNPETEPAFWVNYGRRQLVALGLPPKGAAELAPIISQHMEEQYKPLSVLAEKAHGMLTQLKEAGFKLGVVSNREKPFVQELDDLGITSFFQFSLAAGEVRVYKPDPQIFAAALERVGASAVSTMYVGDNYFADVVGAQRAGLRPVLYDPRSIYPEATCDVIASFDDLLNLLK